MAWLYTSRRAPWAACLEDGGQWRHNDIHVTKQVAGQNACSPDLLMVCVSCKIHSPRISPPAPYEGFSPSRVRTKTCSGVTWRKDVYPPSVRTKTPPELAQRITSGWSKRDMHTRLSATKWEVGRDRKCKVLAFVLSNRIRPTLHLTKSFFEIFFTLLSMNFLQIQKFRNIYLRLYIIIYYYIDIS